VFHEKVYGSDIWSEYLIESSTLKGHEFLKGVVAALMAVYLDKEDA